MRTFSEKLAGVLTAVMRFLESRRGRIAFWVFFGITAIVIGQQTVSRAEIPEEVHVDELHYETPMEIDTDEDHQAEWRSSEFGGFRKLSWGAVVEGIDQYTELHKRAYPPFFAIAFFPFALLWRCRGAGSALFFLIGWGSSLLTAGCLSRWWQRREDKLHFGFFALLWLAMSPFVAAILLRCETDMIVILPISAALLFLARSRHRYVAGALLGFAASFKVLPALFGIYLVAQRRWRALTGMVLAGVVCTVILPTLVWGPTGAWERHLSWYENVIAPYGSTGASEVIGRPYRSTNQSLAAAVHRFTTDIRAGKSGDYRQVNVLDLSPQQAGRIVTVLHGLIGLCLLFLWYFARQDSEPPAVFATVYATVPLGILLLSEVSLTGHHIALFVPVAVIGARALIKQAPRARWWIWSITLAMLICAIGVEPTVELFSPLLIATLLLLIPTVALAMQDIRNPDSPAT